MDDDDLMVVERIDDYRSICISTLARRGYFIYEVDASRGASGINILAKATSYDAASRLIDIWRGRATGR